MAAPPGGQILENLFCGVLQGPQLTTTNMLGAHILELAQLIVLLMKKDFYFGLKNKLENLKDKLNQLKVSLWVASAS